jgi:hypothetical protein
VAPRQANKVLATLIDRGIISSGVLGKTAGVERT